VEARVRSDIREYIVQTWLSGDGRGFDDDTDLQQNGILDSFSLLAFVAFIDSTFEIQLEAAEINAETFRNVKNVASLVIGKVASLRGEA
jgi:acyl carrier protein